MEIEVRMKPMSGLKQLEKKGVLIQVTDDYFIVVCRSQITHFAKGHWICIKINKKGKVIK
jgi:hypothetical protein